MFRPLLVLIALANGVGAVLYALSIDPKDPNSNYSSASCSYQTSYGSSEACCNGAFIGDTYFQQCADAPDMICGANDVWMWNPDGWYDDVDTGRGICYPPLPCSWQKSAYHWGCCTCPDGFVSWMPAGCHPAHSGFCLGCSETWETLDTDAMACHRKGCPKPDPVSDSKKLEVVQKLSASADKRRIAETPRRSPSKPAKKKPPKKKSCCDDPCSTLAQTGFTGALYGGGPPAAHCTPTCGDFDPAAYKADQHPISNHRFGGCKTPFKDNNITDPASCTPEPGQCKMNSAGLALLKDWEKGCPDLYDINGHQTISFGHDCTSQKQNCEAMFHPPIGLDTAYQLLEDDLGTIRDYINDPTTFPNVPYLTSNQLAAITDWAFQAGTTAMKNQFKDFLAGDHPTEDICSHLFQLGNDQISTRPPKKKNDPNRNLDRYKLCTKYSPNAGCDGTTPG